MNHFNDIVVLRGITMPGRLLLAIFSIFMTLSMLGCLPVPVSVVPLHPRQVRPIKLESAQSESKEAFSCPAFDKAGERIAVYDSGANQIMIARSSDLTQYWPTVFCESIATFAGRTGSYRFPVRVGRFVLRVAVAGWRIRRRIWWIECFPRFQSANMCFRYHTLCAIDLPTTPGC
jgi:hypothetical protein